MVTCIMCSGEVMVLGYLGSFAVCRCRNCGWTFNAKLDQEGE